MKTPLELEQINKQIGKDNEIDKVALMLLILTVLGIALLIFFAWAITHHTVNTFITLIVLFLLAKFLSK